MIAFNRSGGEVYSAMVEQFRNGGALYNYRSGGLVQTTSGVTVLGILKRCLPTLVAADMRGGGSACLDDMRGCLCN